MTVLTALTPLRNITTLYFGLFLASQLQILEAKRIYSEVTRILPRDDFTRPCDTFQVGNVIYCSRTSTPVALSNLSEFPEGNDPVGIAKQYLDDNTQILFSDEVSRFEHYFTWESPNSSTMTIRFKQIVDGLEVYNNPNIAVTLKEGEVKFVTSSYQPIKFKNDEERKKPIITKAEARNIALAALGLSKTLNDFDEMENRLAPKMSETLKLFPQESGAILVWDILIIESGLLPSPTWEVLVDAKTSTIIKVDSLIHEATGNGFVFNPDPLAPTSTNYFSQPDKKDYTSRFFDAARVNVTLKDIKVDNGKYKLEGPYARIVDVDKPYKGLFEQSGSNFYFNRKDNAFEAVNCYYHIDTMMRWINEDLGLTIMPINSAGGVKFDPHGANGADNSYYTTGEEHLVFGEGGVDDAEDADVIIHELGHGLHDWVTGKEISQVDGLSEGVGDYLAASYKRSLNVSDPNFEGYNWVFGWDGHNEFWNGRVVNYGATYPDGLVGQIHKDGQIWSTCNMKVYDKIGRRKTDKIMFEGLSMTNWNTNQNIAANAVLEAAKCDSEVSAQNVQMIVSIYKECGYLTCKDDQNWKYIKNNNNFDCGWVYKKGKCNIKSNDEGSNKIKSKKACPIACKNDKNCTIPKCLKSIKWSPNNNSFRNCKNIGEMKTKKKKKEACALKGTNKLFGYEACRQCKRCKESIDLLKTE